MTRIKKWMESFGSKTHETKVSEGGQLGATDKSDVASNRSSMETPTSSRDLDEVLSRLMANIAAEQKAMDDLLTRLRKPAG